MGYVVSNLIPDEEIVYFGSVHWFIFVPGIVLIILGFVVLTNFSGSGWGALIGLLMILYGFFSFVRAVLTYISTELAFDDANIWVTNEGGGTVSKL